MSTPTQAALDRLQASLDALQAGRTQAAAFCAEARDATALVEALPERYGQVLHGLLDRLEAGALFSEESCSFSQQALLDHLQQWLDKARALSPDAA